MIIHPWHAQGVAAIVKNCNTIGNTTMRNVEVARSDGLVIARTHGGYVIIPPQKDEAVTRCPCCGRTLTGIDQAQQVAAERFPVTVRSP